MSQVNSEDDSKRKKMCSSKASKNFSKSIKPKKKTGRKKLAKEPILISKIQIIYLVPQNHPFFFLDRTFDSVDVD